MSIRSPVASSSSRLGSKRRKQKFLHPGWRRNSPSLSAVFWGKARPTPGIEVPRPVMKVTTATVTAPAERDDNEDEEDD